MIVGVGVDVMEVGRMERQIATGDRGFLDQVFTADEMAFCETKRLPARHYAACFAAKEAVLKALAVQAADGILFRQVEIGQKDGRPPRVTLHGRARQRAGALGVTDIFVSLSHENSLAAATAVLEARGTEEVST